ncbi:MAG: helix-turn-helix transcriptional regulator [Clostridium sp.]|nr:helix-turn-helix transcriptional regulator [Clostridium sp.]
MINVSETIKSWRKTHNLSQEALARAVFCDKMTISHYELGKRTPNLDMLEQIANVFGYALDFSVVKKDNSNIDENFYNLKTANEILTMSNEDLAHYIYVTQYDLMIGRICNIDSVLMELLSLKQLKELILKRVSDSNRLSIYYKLNHMYSGFENDMAIFVERAQKHLAEVSEIDYDTLAKVKYLEVDVVYGCFEYQYEFEHIALLDENYEDLGVDMDAINGDNSSLDTDCSTRINAVGSKVKTLKPI